MSAFYNSTTALMFTRKAIIQAITVCSGVISSTLSATVADLEEQVLRGIIYSVSFGS